MKYKILIVLLLSLIKLSGLNRVDIYLTFNDCISCYANLNAIDKLSGYEKNIFIQRADSLVSKEFLEDYPLRTAVNYHYVPFKATSFSYCKVFINNRLTDSFALVILSQKVAQINAYALQSPETKKIRAFNLPKNTVLKNSRLVVHVKGNYINAFDYILNKNILFSIDPVKDTLNKLMEIKGSAFPQNLFLKLGKFDSTLYYSCFDDMKKHGKSVAHIEGSFLGDSSVFLLLNFTHPWLSGKKNEDTIIGMSFFLYERNFISGLKKLAYIDLSGLTKKYKGNYDLHNSKPFYIHPRTRTASFSLLHYTMPNSKLPVFGTFADKGSYQFKEPGPVTLDKDFYLKSKIDSFAINNNAQFYFSIKLKLIIDQAKNKLISLKDVDLPASAYGLDVMEENNVLKLLVLQKPEVEVISYSLKDQKITARGKKQALPDDCSITTVRFYDHKTLVFFDKTSTKLYLMSLED